YLAKAGYAVTVFEKEDKLGGMMRYAIPDFRMDKSAIDDEIALLASMGVEFKTGVAFGADVTAASLKSEGYSAVFAGIGAACGNMPGVPGEDAEGVLSAVEFLKDVYNGKKPQIGKRVVVLGGGFTAVDAARSARRLGAEEVYIAYRRTRDEMPATGDEIDEAEAEGIKIMYLVAPVEIVKNGKKIAAIRMDTQTLSEADNSGRRRPEGVSDAIFTLPCDCVISAVGQKPDPKATSELTVDKRGMIAVDRDTMTADNFVFAGGDAVEVRNIISAIADGRRAAFSIDSTLTGGKPTIEFVGEYPEVSTDKVLRRNPYFTDGEAIELNTEDGAHRVGNWKPFRRVFTEDEAVAEASRCLKCGCGEGCQLCKDICTDFAINIV
ncbi:MAG: FAD-dependent oxidoreductase, partial [Clostridia bacterium]